MTTTGLPHPAAASVRTLVSAEALRRSLAALVRRRVPWPDSDDVLQSALCEALAAERPPEEPAALARWIVGIARHKIADFHRRARREVPSELADPEAPPAPFEARAVLSELLAHTATDARACETLDWIVREAEGEPLAALAREAAVPAPTVRQRVSRLRRALRMRWIAQAAAAAFSLACGLALYRRCRDARAPALAAERRDPPRDTTQAVARLRGTWRVVAIEPGASLGARRRAAARAVAPFTRVRVVGTRLEVLAPGSRVVRELELRAVRGAVADLAARDEHGQWTALTVRFADDGTLGVASDAFGWAGRVTLAR